MIKWLSIAQYNIDKIKCIILQEDLASLLRYESSFTKPGETTSFEEYIKRRQEGQNDIYYLSAPK